MAARDGADGGTGSARRRRERQLRSMLRHERMSVAMALAEKLRHTSRGQRMARAGEDGHEEHDASRRQRPGGGRPEAFVEPRPQERVQRHTVEHITDLVRVAPMVQILDAPVPQTGEQLPDILSFFDALMPVPEQVIEVPKILLDDVPMRAAVRDTQLVEQLVEVPTNPGYALAVVASKLCSRREIRHMLQGRGEGGARGGLQGSLPVQNSAAVVEHIVEIPARRGLPDFLPGQGSSASSSSRLHDDADEAFTVVFRTFLRSKKARSWARTRGRNCSPSRAHPRGELMRTGMLQGDVVTSL